MKYDNSFYFNSIKRLLTSHYSLEKKHFSLFDIMLLKRFINFIQPHYIFSFSTTLSHYSLLLKLLGRFHFRLINGSIRGAPVNLNFQMKFEKMMYSFYGEIVSNSKAGLEAYRQRGKKGRYILYNGYDNGRLPMKNKIELRHQLGINNKFTVAMVASMGESKDQTTLIKAAAIVLGMKDDIQIFLIGDGPKKPEYLALVSSLGFENSIIFTGEVNNPEHYLRASNLSVLMSTNAEGFPNVVLESLACGTPVIANREGGTKEIITDGVNGYLIPRGDYTALASKIVFLKESNDAIERFSRNGLSSVKERFDVGKMILSFEQILKNGIGNRYK